MGSSQSAQIHEKAEEEEDDEEEEEDVRHLRGLRRGGDPELKKKLLEQEPEMLPCHASASPLSPQLSSMDTPRLGPSIKVWDPYNVLGTLPPLPPLPPPPPLTPRLFSTAAGGIGLGNDDHQRIMVAVTEVYLINHGEWEMSLRPELVGGRCPSATLTANGNRQARALAVFLKSQGVRFNVVYTSPLDRARQTSFSVCKEMNIPEEQIQSSDALLEMSHGEWEGCLQLETCTQEHLGLIGQLQPDFLAPSGESLRHVEYRMIQFLNGTLLQLPDKLRSEFYLPHQKEAHGFSQHSSVHDQDGASLSPSSQWDFLHRHRPFTRMKSGKSRLQVVTTTDDHYPDDGIIPCESSCQATLPEVNVCNSSFSSFCIGVFSHSVPIKCLLTGILGCSPIMSQKICIDDSSVTVLQYSWRTGWQIKKQNDTNHLRLL